ncbi:MAG: tRNA 2-thiouridine(34) synthase MnmA [Candidatus Paceibacterota bacterium]|jgi:tRNA-specific 2-thiouridylase
MKSVNNKIKVFVGLSGGVDSAVGSALLLKQGYDVTGVFIKVWQPDWLECNWKEERLSAMRVAAHLGIPFVTLDLEEVYKKEVVDYMISEYDAGRTPNPDVMCNRHVKFGAFWNWAKSKGATYIATGHYARNIETVTTGSDGFSLKTGIDDNKDQSYFLWTLNQNDLKHVLFPVGDIKKPDVRKLAKKFRLPNAEKKDSQGVCFIGKIDFKKFLSHYIKTEPGNVLDESGKVIGTHSGSTLLTIGERHGFTIDKKTPNDKPFYVISKDRLNNTITVSNRVPDEIQHGSLTIARISNVNWVADQIPKDKLSPSNSSSSSPFNLKARCRYRQELENVRIKEASGTKAVIEFEKPQNALTPGQSLVIYDGEMCLGGGIIEV